jgi:hypothetical protein
LEVIVRALHVAVLDWDSRRRAALVARLHGLGVEHIQSVCEGAEAGRARIQSPLDLVMCLGSAGESGCLSFLRDLAVLPAAPAIAIHGPAGDLTETEAQCQRLGLRYLGHLSDPLQGERLERMVNCLRAYQAHGERL